MKHDLHILYEDPDIIVCYKPHGLATQSRRTDVPTLERMILNHIAAEQTRTGSAVGQTHTTSGNIRRSSRQAPWLAVIHRLDQPVAGILVFAKTKTAAKSLNRQLTAGDFSKQYLALVEGRPSPESGTLEDYLVKDAKTNTSRVCDAKTRGAKAASLSYRTLTRPADQKGRTLLEVTLDTGRHHQIRVQLAHHGWPIVGDTKYNPHARETTGWHTLKLCAYRLSFAHPVTGKPMEFETGQL